MPTPGSQLFAVRRPLEVDPKQDGVEAVLRHIGNHEIATGTLIGTYAR